MEKVLVLHGGTGDMGQVEDILKIEGLEFNLASLADVKGHLSIAEYDFIFLDISGEEKNLDIIDSIHRKRPDLPVIVLSDSLSQKQARESFIRGATGYLPKPLNRMDVQSVILLLPELVKRGRK